MHQRFSYGPPVPTFFVYPPLSNTRQCIQTHRQPALQRATFTGYSDVNMPRQKLWSYPPWIPQDYYILFPVEGQRRRWSETAATEVRTGEEEVRRWSMHPPLTRTDYSNLKYPYLWEDRVWDPEWQTATVGTMHTTVGDGLADALQLLSLRPLSKVIHNPTPTNTTSSHSIQHESWPLDTNSKSHYPGVEAGVEKASTVSATIDIPATVAQILNFLWTDEEPIYVGCVKRSSDLASLQEED